MFDDLHDPDPPRPDASVLNRVIARAERRRRKRRVATAGLAAVVLLVGGTAIVATSGIEPDATITDRPVDPDHSGGEEADDPAPTDIEVPATSLPGTAPVLSDADPTDRISYLAFGDGVMLGAAFELSARGIVVDAQIDRQVGDVVPTVRELRDQDLLGAAVIVHLGTNGPISSGALDELMDLLDEVQHVLVLTVGGDEPWIDPNNELLRGLGERSNVIVVDWAALAPTCPGDCLTGDGIHLRPDGRRFYATAIGDVLGLDPGATADVSSDGSMLGDVVPRVHIVADPVMAQARDVVGRSGVSVIETATQTLGEATTELRMLHADDSLARVVIAHVGTETEIDASELDELIDALDGLVANLVVATTHGNQAWTPANNELIRTVATRNTIDVFDWADRVDACPGECFGDDGQLLTDGQWFYATELAAFVGFEMPDRVTQRELVEFVVIDELGDAHLVNPELTGTRRIFDGPDQGPNQATRAVASTASGYAFVAMCCEPLSGELLRIDLADEVPEPERIRYSRGIAMSPDGASIAVAEVDTILAGALNLEGFQVITIPPDAGIIYDLVWFVSPNIETAPSPFTDGNGQLAALARTPNGISLITMNDIIYTATADHSTLIDLDPNADIRFAGITDDGHILIHNLADPDQLTSYDPVNFSPGSPIELPAAARSAWHEAGHTVWIDTDGTLHTGTTTIPGRYTTITGS